MLRNVYLEGELGNKFIPHFEIDCDTPAAAIRCIDANFPDFKPKCWVRRNMEPREEIRIIKAFVDELQALYNQKQRIMPQWINNALDKIENEIFELTLKKIKVWKLNKLRSFKRTLENILKLDIFGYNSRFFISIFS